MNLFIISFNMNKSFLYYNVAFLFTLFLTGAILYSLNDRIDPLWYENGNQYSQQNFVFNERISKINLFENNKDSHNCVIFGSSRTTLLPDKQIKLAECLNLSFSAGMIGEFLVYAQYLQSKSYSPQLVIVGVDGFDFFYENVTQSVPSFIEHTKPPPAKWQSYLNLATFHFSLKSLLHYSRLPRYYDGQFQGKILPNTLHFNPYTLSGLPRSDLGELVWDNVLSYLAFKNIFPKATVIFYVPPISLWHIIDMKEKGKLQAYLKGIYHLASQGYDVYDFSVPSFYTTSVLFTYDGSHYIPAVNDLIVDRLNGAPTEFGIRVNDMSFDEYIAHFQEALVLYQKQMPQSDDIQDGRIQLQLSNNLS